MATEDRGENYYTERDISDIELVGGDQETSERSRIISANFEGILDSLPFYVLLVDAEHNIAFANKAVRATFGMTLEQVTGQYCPKLVHGLDHPYPGCPVQQAIKGGPVEKEHFAPELGNRWLLTSAYPTGVKTEKGLDIYFHTVRDITEEKNVQESIKVSEKKYRTLFEEIKDIIFMMTPDGILQDINRAGLRFLDMGSWKEVPHINLFSELSLVDSEWEPFKKALGKDGVVEDYEISVKRPGGDIAIVSVNASMERDDEGKEVMIRGIMRDMTRNRELEMQTTTDELTSLYNHGFFETYLVNKVRHIQADVGKDLTVLFLDIDDFKAYNDSFGHQEGDYVLRKVSESIMKAVRGEDIASRYGGEEFTMILNCDFEKALVVAERIRSTIEDLCSSFADRRIKRSVTASIGLATLGLDGETAEKLVRVADARMYEAKKQGKNCIYSGEVDLDAMGIHVHLPGLEEKRKRRKAS